MVFREKKILREDIIQHSIRTQRSVVTKSPFGHSAISNENSTVLKVRNILKSLTYRQLC